ETAGRSWPVRLVWTGAVALALIGIAAAVRRALVLQFGIGVNPLAPALDAGFARHPLLTFVHILPGALFMALGPFQFSSAFRDRHVDAAAILRDRVLARLHPDRHRCGSVDPRDENEPIRAIGRVERTLGSNAQAAVRRALAPDLTRS